MTAAPTIERVTVSTYRFPAPHPESDGTLTWDATTAVAAEVHAGNVEGLGWTYSGTAAAAVIVDNLTPAIRGRDTFDIEGAWSAMHRACRNLGTKGLVMQAISAVDIALWDLKARLLAVPVTTLFGQVRDRVPIYGSGGFTSSTDTEIAQDVAAWRAAGCRSMKIKIGKAFGSDVEWDVRRAALLREIAGPDIELMVDANGAYTCGQAKRVGEELADLGLRWFEEPVSSDDKAGLADLRGAVTADVAAGEYISDTYDAQALAPVVSCLQLDATRCGGYTGFLRGCAIAAAHNLDVSGHCAPSLHAPVAAAVPRVRHVEWFTDHVRLEPLLVDGAPTVSGGTLEVTSRRPGHGMTLAAGAADYRL
ncbi:enolase C-terminal domain-like protein [Mycolicibacterium aichiense]|uniref:Mandelate racemase n=1 Tax=Mycolicibacterium aichiense TaxID=1799 RepID=A0AAD1HMK3_9MYCO|nr:enolase C-terminal domain-like protein [Mycolicibacterium aichiense]MCV7019473.1 mandelate racemase [Mycolicibacterium aichiense]BBX08218.1 mandelate racemase [Mycolicibacterium aichiense]STZ82022.1 enolase superfamily enzyme related to L-alanine-DL-glutamate epimerase [Mycolicibacterium aichiense]